MPLGLSKRCLLKMLHIKHWCVGWAWAKFLCLEAFGMRWWWNYSSFCQHTAFTVSLGHSYARCSFRWLLLDIFLGSCEESPGQQRSLLGTNPARCCDAILWTALCATCTFAFHPWWSSPSSGILSWENQILWVRLLACCEMLSFQVAEAMSQ